MKERIEQLQQKFREQLEQAHSAEELEALRLAFVGKRGHVAELMSRLRDAADKKEAGQMINRFKTEVEDALAAAGTALKDAALKARIRGAKKYNPGMIAEREYGSYHPITLLNLVLYVTV